jgi:uroporphyrinogen-III decarboxylase
VLTGKERLGKAFRCETVDRAPWVPFVGCHGGALLGLTATDYLKSEPRLIEGVEAAIARYRPDGIPVAFDLQIEAEVLGCELNWTDETPPSVRNHPLTNGHQLEALRVPTPGVRPHQDRAGGSPAVVPPSSRRGFLRSGDRSLHVGAAPAGDRHFHEDV